MRHFVHCHRNPEALLLLCFLLRFFIAALAHLQSFRTATLLRCNLAIEARYAFLGERSYLFIRVAVRELSPPALMELRLLLATPVLLAYCAARGRVAEVEIFEVALS